MSDDLAVNEEPSGPAPEGRGSGPSFSCPPYDHVEDLCGDLLGADLIAFFAGNQFMAMGDLLDAFRRERPGLGGVFYETLPPGILVEQLQAGTLRLGSLELRLRPDVLAASPAALARLGEEGLVGPGTEYASNELAILVRAGNPKGIRALGDLAADGIVVALPHVEVEGIGRLAIAALEAAGGPELVKKITVDKAERRELRINAIHHRESPTWIESGAVDAAIAWRTEAVYHRRRGAPIEGVEIPPEHNQRGRYAIAAVNGAPHPELADDFVRFMAGPTSRSVYARHEFAPPAPQSA